ncbi:MAG TPA: hypothetical protein VN256_14290 [Pyrinomonadaceae bacterium]|nr:hypothetical protein [Pyrinomonadaceae bacterium]
MLRQKHADLSFTGAHAFTPAPRRWAELSRGGGGVFGPYASSSEEGAGGPEDDADAPLDDAARGEREYVRRRLREELQREPTEGELDEWLRQHTEGY